MDSNSKPNDDVVVQLLNFKVPPYCRDIED